MIVTAWRIVQVQFKASAMTGEGASRFPGRWNLRGTRMIYAAGSLSLAAMEMLVHLESSDLLGRYASIPIRFDSSLCLRLPTSRLPQNWTDNPAPMSTRRLGSAWAKEKNSAFLAVPSALVSVETNYLINPLHLDFRKVEIGKAVAFQFDSRLVKRS